MARFFISCPLGFEAELAKELRSFWFEMIDLDGLPTRSDFPEHEEVAGGLELQCAEHLGFQIGFFTKLANRVLYRIGKFESRYYDQFEKALAKLELEKYMTPQPLKIKIEHHKSRLNNEKNLLEACSHVLPKKKYLLATEAQHTLYLRIEKDVVTVSLDASGEHLHKRGYAAFRGEAPLRENLAAYVLKKIESWVSLDEKLMLIDPFVGSGTFLLEACSLRQPNFSRSHAWQDFLTAPKLFKSESWKKNYRWFQPAPGPLCVGYDVDAKAIQNFEKNKVEFEKIFHPGRVTANCQNSHDLQIQKNLSCTSVWVVCNPPYGIRMEDGGSQEILEGLEDSLDGLAVIHPDKWKFQFRRLKTVFSEDFRNQGLNLKLTIFSRNS